jgi:DNA-directed RNA polymerase specialized sigma24 family protein
MPSRHAAARRTTHDPAEAVARALAEKREVLLRAYRRRLRREDLEDCLSQAALELVVRARRVDAGFQNAAHIANALEQKLRSRIYDRHRAMSGKSAIETALAKALPLEEADGQVVHVADRRADSERLVEARIDLRRLLTLAHGLTPDQRRVLFARVVLDMSATEFCEGHAWSFEKYRKIDQRGRAKLRLATRPSTQ